jgi:hypothetical protein
MKAALFAVFGFLGFGKSVGASFAPVRLCRKWLRQFFSLSL